MFEHLPFSVLQTTNTQHRSDKWRRVKSVSVSQSAEKVNNKQITCLTSFTQSERIELDMNVKYTQKNFYNALAFTAAFLFLYPEFIYLHLQRKSDDPNLFIFMTSKCLFLLIVSRYIASSK